MTDSRCQSFCQSFWLFWFPSHVFTFALTCLIYIYIYMGFAFCSKHIKCKICSVNVVWRLVNKLFTFIWRLIAFSGFPFLFWYASCYWGRLWNIICSLCDSLWVLLFLVRSWVFSLCSSFPPLLGVLFNEVVKVSSFGGYLILANLLPLL
jgi:hypothetical protein